MNVYMNDIAAQKQRQFSVTELHHTWENVEGNGIGMRGYGWRPEVLECQPKPFTLKLITRHHRCGSKIFTSFDIFPGQLAKKIRKARNKKQWLKKPQKACKFFTCSKFDALSFTAVISLILSQKSTI